MRRVLFYCAATALCLLSCTERQAEEGRLRFTGGIVSRTSSRVEFDGPQVKWNGGDMIGIYSEEVCSNIPYAAAADALQAEFQPVAEEVGSGRLFCAYYPYSALADGAPARAVPCGVPAVQSFREGENPDKLFLRAGAAQASGGIVALEFESVFSVLEFQLRGQGRLARLRLEASCPLAGSATIDLTSGAASDLTDTSNSIEVDFGPDGLNLSAQAQSVPVSVLPFSCQGPARLILTDVSGFQTVRELWPEGLTLQANVHAVQPLSAIAAAECIWDDDFASPDIRGQVIAIMTSGPYEYKVEEPKYLHLLYPGLRLSTDTEVPAAISTYNLKEFLPAQQPSDLILSMSVRSVAAGTAETMRISVTGAGSASVAEAAIPQTDYGTVQVAISGADASTGIRLQGNFYMSHLAIFCIKQD